MTAKIKNDRFQYTRRADLSSGAPAKLSGHHLKPNAKRAERVAKQLTPMQRVFIEL
jgi:hypothetical protein